MSKEKKQSRSAADQESVMDRDDAVMETEEPVIAGTKDETDKKCPDCGGVMDFNPENGTLTCPYCGHSEQIQVEEENFVAKELDFDQAEDEEACDWGTATKTVVCKSCGAQTVYDVNQIANECPYCGSNQVMEASDSRVMAPGGVVPFKLDSKKASVRFKDWIGKKFFCPKLAKESAKPKSFQGLYVPYWTFDTSTHSRYEGEYGINRQYKDKEGKTQTKTDWYRTRGRHDELFDDFLICGSSEQDESMIGDLEPFDTTQVVAYKPEYMAGFSAARYTIKVKDAWESAKRKIKSILKSNVEGEIRTRNHADSVRSVELDTSFEEVTYKYLLLPVWISSFKYKDKVYHFMVNGQTGKVSGSTPISWVKVAFVAAAVVAVIAIVVSLTSGDADAAMTAVRMLG